MAITEIVLSIVLLVLLRLSAYFSSMETAFVSLDMIAVKEMIADGKKHAQKVADLKKKEHELLITILIGNNLANIGASATATYLTMKLVGDAYIGLMTGLLTLIVLVFGEITPKTRASIKAREIALKNAVIISFLITLFKPVIIILDWITRKLLGEDKESFKKRQDKISEEMVRRLINISEREGEINRDEKEMIHNVLEFNDITAKKVMTPRTEIFAIDINDDVEDNIRKIIDNNYSRIPVYSKEIDNIIGMLYLKDLLKLVIRNREREQEITKTDIKQLLRKPLIISEHKKIDQLFKEFQKERNHVAIVVDEYGGVEGLVTMEDLIEEIVGEIYDETDEVEKNIIEDNNSYHIKGSTLITDINEKTGLAIPESDNYETISGLVLYELKRLPEKGEKITINDLEIKIEQVRNNTIEQLKIRKKEPDKDNKDEKELENDKKIE